MHRRNISMADNKVVENEEKQIEKLFCIKYL